jgi:hypothetical protein
MADEGKIFKVRKMVAPVAKPKAKPKAKSNTLYVTDPNDKRLKMYEDSTLATGRAVEINKKVEELKKMPAEKARVESRKGVDIPSQVNSAISRLQNVNKKPYTEGKSESVYSPVQAPEGFGYKDGVNKLIKNPKNDKGKYIYSNTINVYGKNVLTPKRKVVLVKPEEPKPEKPKPTPVAPPRPKPKPVKELEIRPASKILVKEEEEKERDVKMVPVKKPLKEKRIGAGSILRNPDQSLLGKIKRRFNGEPNERYWVDKDGVKRYSSRGEDNPQAVREKEMLKEGLNPKVPEDKMELDRIEARYSKPPKK